MTTTSAPDQLVSALDRGSGARSDALRDRAAELARVLRAGEAAGSAQEIVDVMRASIEGGERGVVWLTLAVLRAELPTHAAVVAASREARLDGPDQLLARLLTLSRNPLDRGRELRRVEVVEGAVLVDVSHTSRTALATGIQRVTREVAARWVLARDVTLVGWTRDDRVLRRLDDRERRTALTGEMEDPHYVGGDSTVLVPWGGTYLLPELATETHRTERIQALADHTATQTGVIGFDCVPLSSGETVGPAMGSAFARNLAAVRHMDKVAAISDAAALEYTGWRRMLAGLGVPGPQIRAIPLPLEAQPVSPGVVARLRAAWQLDERPLVLCVGSHEPRKNHLAVLHAAELAWREGHDFQLVFVGGNSWGADGFRERLEYMQSQNRPVMVVTALADELLWAAYTVARCVVFPSLNEGFGLPVAEAIATGTPAITSGYGSMAEIARTGGALLVDPRDDRDIARAIASLVSDDALHQRLVAEAKPDLARTWTTYADELWDYLTGE